VVRFHIHSISPNQTVIQKSEISSIVATARHPLYARLLKGPISKFHWGPSPCWRPLALLEELLRALSMLPALSLALLRAGDRKLIAFD
jgi:hypothetical protein